MKTVLILLASIIRFSPQQVKADLDYLYRNLQEAHYDLYVNMPKAKYDSTYHALYNSIHDSMSTVEVTRAFQRFIALGEVAHCNVGFPGSLYFDSTVQHTDYLFPLVIANGIVTHNFSADKSIRPGDKIAFPEMNEAIDMMSGESRAMRHTLVELYTFPRIYWWRYGSQQTFKVKINGKVVVLKGVLASELEKELQQLPSVFNTDREFRMIGDIAYLHPGMFLNNETVVNTSDHSVFVNNEFMHFIDSAFLQIHHLQAKQLLIDLRGNPGGDNSFSDPMIAYFANKPFWFCQNFSIRTSAITKQFWKDVTDSSLLDLKTQILQHENGDTFSVKFGTYAPRTDSLHFNGKVYVLVDRFSYSNAVSVAAIIQDYQLGRVMGEPTADIASTYGAAHEITLPNTGLNVSYPKAFIVRPNGNKQLRGVTPDIIIDTTSAEILNAAIKYMSQH